MTNDDSYTIANMLNSINYTRNSVVSDNKSRDTNIKIWGSQNSDQEVPEEVSIKKQDHQIRSPNIGLIPNSPGLPFVG